MADEYERTQMPGIGQVLFRHKVSSPRWLMGLMTGIPFGIGGAAGIGTMIGGLIGPGLGILAGGAAAAAFFAFLMVTFSTARIAVSDGEVHLQLGPAGPRIPIEEIASVHVGPSGSNRMGMGVRNDLRGTTVYTLWGDNAQAVHIGRTDGTKLIVVMKEPEAMARAIEEAMRRRDRTKVRVDAGEDEVEQVAQQVEHEVEAERARRGRSIR